MSQGETHQKEIADTGITDSGWKPYEGPQGGQGWQNVQTGEIRYQQDPPTSATGADTETETADATEITTVEEVEQYVDNFLDSPQDYNAEHDWRPKMGKGASEEWRAFEQAASTEALQAYFDAQTAEARDDLFARVPDAIEHDYKTRMIGGILAAREDADIAIDDIINVHGDSVANPDAGDVSKTDLLEGTQRVIDNLHPLMAGVLFTTVDTIESAAADDSFPPLADGRFTQTDGTETESPKNTVQLKTWDSQSPDPLAHELGHIVHYMLGIDRASGTRNVKMVWEKDHDDWESGLGLKATTDDRSKQMFYDITDQWEKFVATSAGDSTDCEPLWQYQKMNGHEFIAVAFAHWIADPDKLREYQPGMTEIFETYLGRGSDQ